jgi:HEAT repeat protein
VIPALLVLVLHPQDPAVRELVEKLRSDAVEEREEATRRLRTLGRAAAPELEKAARDPDAEVASRARLILRMIDLGDRLTPRLRAAMPGVEERLLRGGAHAWTEVFLEASNAEKFATLAPRDLAALALPALSGAIGGPEKLKLCDAVMKRSIYAAAPGVAAFLKDPGSDLVVCALQALCQLGACESAADIVPLLKHQEPGVRFTALGALDQLKARETIADILPLLKDEDEKVRRRAVETLTALEARPAVPHLVPLLDDKVLEVYANVIRALGRLGARGYTERLARFLDDEDPFVRAETASTLAALDARDRADDIAPLLEDESEAGRATAAAALARLGARKWAPTIAPLLSDPVEDVRRAAVDALLRIGNDETLAKVVELLKEPADADYVAAALSTARAKAAAPALLKLLDDDRVEVRRAAADALPGLATRESVPRLVRLLGDPDDGVRMSAAWALEVLRPAEALPDLIKLLESGAAESRPWVVWSLGGIGSKEAIPAVLRILDRPDDPALRAAIDAAGRLGAREATPSLLRLLKKADAPGRADLALALAALDARAAAPELAAFMSVEEQGGGTMYAVSVLDPARAIDALRPLLKHDRPGIRGSAAIRLGMMGAREARPDLEVLLRDPDYEVRGYVVKALGLLGVTDRMPELEQAMEDPRSSCEALIEGLRWTPSMEAVPLLARFLEDPADSVCGRAAQALAQRNARDLVPRIRKLLLRAGSNCRKEAGSALCRLGSREGVSVLLDSFEPGNRPELLPLNALRRPEAWSKLGGHKPGETLVGSGPEILARIAREAGLALEFTPPRFPKVTYLLYRQREPFRHRIWHQDGRLSLLDALEEVLAWTGCDAVLENDRLRVLPAPEALEFWKSWWEEEKWK